MRLEVKGRNVEVSDSIRRYAEEKLEQARAAARRADSGRAGARVGDEPSIAEDHIAEATIWTKGPTLRARESSNAFETSIDQLVGQARAPGEAVPREAEPARDRSPRERPASRTSRTFSGEQLDRMIVKSKQFDLQPLTPDEAAVELELIGHDFFVFTNDETGKTNVVYRRRARRVRPDRATGARWASSGGARAAARAARRGRRPRDRARAERDRAGAVTAGGAHARARGRLPVDAAGRVREPVAARRGRRSTASRAAGRGTRSRPSQAPSCPGTEVHFVALPDGTLIVEKTCSDGR